MLKGVRLFLLIKLIFYDGTPNFNNVSESIKLKQVILFD